MMNSLRDAETLWVPERLIKERVGERGRIKCIEGERRGKKCSSLEVELVLQSLLPHCSKWKREEGGLWPKKPLSLILIKKHKEHQRLTPNLYQSGAPTNGMILKVLSAIQCQVLRKAQGLG